MRTDRFRFHRRPRALISRLAMALALFTQFALAAQACLLPQAGFAMPSGDAQVSVPCNPQGAADPFCDEPGTGQSGGCLMSLTQSDQSTAFVSPLRPPMVLDLPPLNATHNKTVHSVAAPQRELWTRFSSPPLPVLFCRFQT